jgi:Fibronectin type III domain
MSDFTEQQRFLPQIRVAQSTCMPLRLTAIITGLLSIMPVLTGCGDGGETGSNPRVTMAPGVAGATVSLKWDPVLGSSVSAYFVYYGKQSPNQSGSCVYERSISVDSPSATVTNLDPTTLYYFAVSAYNGRESPCSEEVSTVTPSTSA